LNAYAEQFVRTIKESCLNRTILFGEDSLRKSIQEFTAHYYFERHHQGLGMAAAAVLSGYAPARRASGIDPMALGHE
jgi:ABC-type lipoprotein release transport system permease subunit